MFQLMLVASLSLFSAGDVHRDTLGILTGVVMIDSTQQPLVGVEVTLTDIARSTLTNERGAFRLEGIPAGEHTLSLRHVGYAAQTSTITFRAGETIDRKIYLAKAVTLDSVRVNARAIDPIMRDFEEHKRVGLGHFLTRADLAKVDNVKLSSVLESISGLGVVHGRNGQGWVQSRRKPPVMDCPSRPRGTSDPPPGTGSCYVPDRIEMGTGMAMGCYAQVYLDHMLMNPTRPAEPFDVNTIAVDQIEAVEFYSGPSQTPAEYMRTNSPCGVLVLHTRRP